MQSPSLSNSTPKTIDPFAFPSETDGRFRMFMFSILMVALYISFITLVAITQLWGPILFGDVFWGMQVMWQLTTVLGERDFFSLSDNEIRALAHDMQVMQVMSLIHGLPRLCMLVAFGQVLIGTIYAIYRTHPRLLYRRQRLRSISSFSRVDLIDQVQRVVRSIAMQVGVAPPTVAIMTNDYRDAQVFGLPNQYVLRLNARRLGKRVDEICELSLRCMKEDFRALVLHELAHIVNRDVMRSQLAWATWRVFIGLVLVPTMTLSLIGMSLPFVQILQREVLTTAQLVSLLGDWSRRMLILTLQVIGIVLVLRVNWAALLRVREFYADWRATLWGVGTPLKALLSESARQSQSEHPRVRSIWHRLWLPAALHRLAAWCRSQWYFHTPPEERLKCLMHPHMLFQVPKDLAWQTGILLAFVMGGLPFLIMYLTAPFFAAVDALSWSVIQLVMDIFPPPINRATYILICLVSRIMVPVLSMVNVLFLVTYMLTDSLGRQIQRAAVIDLLPNDRPNWGYVGLLKTALWIAAGLEFGFWIIPSSIFVVRGWISLALIPLWLLIFVILTWFWLVYVRALNQRLIGTHAGPALVRGKQWLIASCSVIALWALYLPVLPARVIISFTAFFPGWSSIYPDEATDATFAFTIFLLFGVGLVLFLLWAGFSLGLIWIWSHVRRPRCTVCRAPVPGAITVGRRCRYCYSHLAVWLYVRSGSSV